MSSDEKLQNPHLERDIAEGLQEKAISETLHVLHKDDALKDLDPSTKEFVDAEAKEARNAALSAIWKALGPAAGRLKDRVAAKLHSPFKATHTPAERLEQAQHRYLGLLIVVKVLSTLTVILSLLRQGGNGGKGLETVTDKLTVLFPSVTYYLTGLLQHLSFDETEAAKEFAQSPSEDDEKSNGALLQVGTSAPGPVAVGSSAAVQVGTTSVTARSPSGQNVAATSPRAPGIDHSAATTAPAGSSPSHALTPGGHSPRHSVAPGSHVDSAPSHPVTTATQVDLHPSTLQLSDGTHHLPHPHLHDVAAASHHLVDSIVEHLPRPSHDSPARPPTHGTAPTTTTHAPAAHAPSVAHHAAPPKVAMEAGTQTRSSGPLPQPKLDALAFRAIFPTGLTLHGLIASDHVIKLRAWFNFVTFVDRCMSLLIALLQAAVSNGWTGAVDSKTSQGFKLAAAIVASVESGFVAGVVNALGKQETEVASRGEKGMKQDLEA